MVDLKNRGYRQVTDSSQNSSCGKTRIRKKQKQKSKCTTLQFLFSPHHIYYNLITMGVDFFLKKSSGFEKVSSL